MKRIISVTLLLIMLLAFTACNGTETPTQIPSQSATENSEQTLVATETPTLEITQETATVPAVTATATPTIEITQAPTATNNPGPMETTNIDFVDIGMQNEYDYNTAIALLNEHKYQEAYDIFRLLGDYKDSKDYVDCFLIEYEKINYDGTYTYNFEVDDSGRILKITFDHGNYTYLDFEHIYDENGNIIQFNSASGPYKYYYEGDKIVKCEYKEYHGATIFIDYTYHENGNLHTKQRNGDGDVYAEFDADGKLLKYGYTDYDVVPEQHKYEYEYDDKGRLVKKEYTIDDAVQFVETYTYNDDDTLAGVATDNFWSYKELTYQYQYGDDFRLIKKTEYCDGSSKPNKTWEYEYFDNGTLKKEVQYDHAKGSFNVLQYDKYSNLTQEINNYSDGERFTYTYTYNYDKNGNYSNYTEECLIEENGELKSTKTNYYTGKHVFFDYLRFIRVTQIKDWRDFV